MVEDSTMPETTKEKYEKSLQELQLLSKSAGRSGLVEVLGASDKSAKPRPKSSWVAPPTGMNAEDPETSSDEEFKTAHESSIVPQNRFTMDSINN